MFEIGGYTDAPGFKPFIKIVFISLVTCRG